MEIFKNCNQKHNECVRRQDASFEPLTASVDRSNGLIIAVRKGKQEKLS